MKPTTLDHVTCNYGVKGDWAAGYHTGIDYRAEVGTKILATRRGRVVHAGYGGIYGSAYGCYVVIKSFHRGRFRQHLYAHLSKNTVKTGQRVKAGTVIGLSGDTGNTNGPHLHYEERVSPFGYWNHYKPILPLYVPLSKRIKKKLKNKKNR